jgi:two-component system, response regulator PdtaR
VSRTILIVEDEFLIAMDLQLLLEESGWQVFGPAGSVRDALRLIEVELPSVALLDVNLAGELVTPLAEALKRRGVPFALASAHERPEKFGGAVLAGAPNAGKPTNARRLEDALIQALKA